MKLTEKLALLASSYLPSNGASGHQNISREAMEPIDVSSNILDIDLDKFGVIKSAPVWMTRAERLLLFSMTFCLRPQRYLEIGTLQGGSALLVSTAMDAAQLNGKIVCVDPEPKIAAEDWARMEHRATMLKGFSPDVLPEAESKAGGKFDMILIDGDHTREGVIRDIDGVLPHAANGCYLLFHDSFFPDVQLGIEYALKKHTATLTDFGTMTREVSMPPDDPNKTQWGGIRMAQVRR